MTVRQTRATIERGRANSQKGQKPGDANYITSIGPPAGYQPTPTRLQQLRQQVSDARRAQLTRPELERRVPLRPVRVQTHADRHRGICGFCGRQFVGRDADEAKSRVVDHIARDHPRVRGG